MKTPTALYSCSRCGAQTTKWSGRCLECGEWGSLKEDAFQTTESKPTARTTAKPGELHAFTEETSLSAKTSTSGVPSLDLVLGGGLVQGSVSLIAGEPGIGKSTLLAQSALALSKTEKRVIYVTGEESPAQIQRRLKRLTQDVPKDLLFLNNTSAEVIAATIEAELPGLIIIDSIQTLHTSIVSGEAGSVGQVKACAAIITESAKRSHVPVILVGQVTKDGDVAGPRVLEHLVDSVLFLEGDNQHRYRLLRVLKHRFGPTDEVALLTMTERGLEAVEDASQELIRDRPKHISGSTVTCLIEGHRPMLIELQALVSPAGYGTPIRRATGADPARLGMLLAVLARRAGLNALDKDVYANAAGGIEARDPSVDVALAAAIASAVKDIPVESHVGMFGEVGLAGELRPVAMPELRLKEFARMGFTHAIVPKGQTGSPIHGLTVTEASTLKEALQIARII
jgi:DNA repair protein RadA/Sms